MFKYALIFGGAVLLSLVLTPIVRGWAIKRGILDLPSARKIHEIPTPMLGGIPIFLAFNAAILAGLFLGFSYFQDLRSHKWLVFFICELIILGLGIFDDIKKVRPYVKFAFQIAAGILLILAGFGIKIVTNPFNGQPIHLGVFGMLLTVVWMVGITNALNLVDGLDGLAAGTSFFAGMSIFGMAVIYQNVTIALVSLAFAGSLLGFLKYNFYPAKIFLGDSGSLYLGFVLSVLSIESVHRGAVLVAALAPILVLGLPILDTFLSIVRRFLKPISHESGGVSGEAPAETHRLIPSIFTADKNHIHHRLMKLGFAHKKAVILLYGISVLLCVLSFVAIAWQNINMILLIGAILIALLIGVRSLKYDEFRLLDGGFVLPFFDIPLISKRLFQSFLDLCLIALSFYLAFLLAVGKFDSKEIKVFFLGTIPVVIVLKILAFLLVGLYRGSWKYANLGDFIRVFEAVLLGSFVSVAVLSLLRTPNAGYRFGPVFFVLDFYFLLTLSIGARMSFRLFDYFYRSRLPAEGRNVLIYGAGRHGALLIRELQLQRDPQVRIVGFIDDDKRKIGSYVQHIPVVGGSEDADGIFRRLDVEEVICSTSKIDPDRVARLARICLKRGIILKTFEIKISDMG
jgi:UDP-N-acetylmuramyl pentapeptide phosphotransferase/UDP-N-acetylglucosamine-1-phosphate transferase